VQLIKEGQTVVPEVEIPLVTEPKEFFRLQELVEKVAGDVRRETGVNFKYLLGTMIELPRAALMTDEIAREAKFISFGTNDLTQTTMGVSRDDAEGKFLQHYVEEKILSDNPFMVLDRKGVGKLMKISVELGRSVRPELVVGICGEHGGEPSSIEFCHLTGMNYVSCSPFRVPIARLAAAQASIKHGNLTGREDKQEMKTKSAPHSGLLEQTGQLINHETWNNFGIKH